jgi:hypothetical protein
MLLHLLQSSQFLDDFLYFLRIKAKFSGVDCFSDNHVKGLFGNLLLGIALNDRGSISTSIFGLGAECFLNIIANSEDLFNLTLMFEASFRGAMLKEGQNIYPKSPELLNNNLLLMGLFCRLQLLISGDEVSQLFIDGHE